MSNIMTVEKFCVMLEKNKLSLNSIKNPSDKVNPDMTIQDVMNIWSTAIEYVNYNIVDTLPDSIAEKLTINEVRELKEAISAAGAIVLSENSKRASDLPKELHP